jgi:quercetin dioxygenase-like cupin family protein
MPTMKTVTTTVKEGSPMTVESRIFSVAEYVQPSEGEPIRSVVLETRDSIIVVWHVHPGQEIAAHIHPHGQTRGLFCREWLITFRAMGLFVPQGKVR